MYMRMVQAKVRPEALPHFRKLYDDRVIPALRTLKGCMHASLLQSNTNPEDCISLTLWKERANADAYESSGIFSKLVSEASEFFTGETDWSLHLTSDLTLQYDPVPEPPTVKAYVIPSSREIPIFSGAAQGSIFIRMVTPQLRPEAIAEFKKTYTETILPHLRSVEGCIYAYLVENLKQKDQVISLTIWLNREAAETYERSGRFEELTHTIDPFFTEMYQWKQQLAREVRGRSVTSEEMSVEGYNVVTGKTFL